MDESEDHYNQEPSSAFFVRGDCQLSENNEPLREILYRR